MQGSLHQSKSFLPYLWKLFFQRWQPSLLVDITHWEVGSPSIHSKGFGRGVDFGLVGVLRPHRCQTWPWRAYCLSRDGHGLRSLNGHCLPAAALNERMNWKPAFPDRKWGPTVGPGHKAKCLLSAGTEGKKRIKRGDDCGRFGWPGLEWGEGWDRVPNLTMFYDVDHTQWRSECVTWGHCQTTPRGLSLWTQLLTIAVTRVLTLYNRKRALQYSLTELYRIRNNIHKRQYDFVKCLHVLTHNLSIRVI